MSEIELDIIEPVNVVNGNLNSSSVEPIPSCSFQTEEINPIITVRDRKDRKQLSNKGRVKITDYDNISMRSISDIDDSSSERNEVIIKSNENSQHLAKVPEMISDLLSKMAISLPGTMANSMGSCQPATQNSNRSTFGNVFINGSKMTDIGDKNLTTVNQDVIINDFVNDENKELVKSKISETDHTKYKNMKTVTDKTENKTQWMSVIFLIVSLIAAIYLLYLALPKWIINSPKIYPDGLVVISRTNWSPNPMVKPLHKLSLPVELIIISHTMTKNCTNRWDCATIVRSDPVQEREFNFLIGDDGIIFEGSGWNKKGSHTNSFFNKRSICFAFIGTYHYYPPSIRQIETVKKMIEKGVRLGNVMENYKLSAACQLAFGRGLGAALNDEIKHWAHYVGPIDKSKLKHHRQKRSTKQKKMFKSKPKLKLKPNCYKHSQ